MPVARVLATPPVLRMEVTTSSQASILRELTITWAPQAANKRAVASPMPRLAPVIRTVLPVKSVRDDGNIWVMAGFG